MSKRPVQPTLERSGFTVTKIARLSREGESEVENDVDVEVEAGNGRRVRANRGKWSRNEWKWQIDYDWLDFFYETGKTYCKICRKARGKTCWAKEGTLRISTSSFIEHGGGDDHRACCAVILLGENPLDKVVKMATVRCDDAMVILFRTAYLIAKESLAFSQFPKLMKLSVIQVQVLDRVRASPFWGLMIDESTDVSVTSHLVVFCTFLEDGQIRTAFLGLLHIPHKDSHSIA
ncbi:hypothetical protein R1sor_008194 [Riccia sorocarpa]|uniref:C17orf113 probable zinc finger domain-containing protein n=1 Tax=Riccia sorocarpa TaxID=122646 RepID=A0ABD3HSW6_9MARC